MRVLAHLRVVRDRSPGLRRLVVCSCVALTLAALVVRYPQSFADANETARANAGLDLLDLQLGAGSSVLPDQSVAIEARGRIPPDGTFTVSVGEPLDGWPELTTPGIVDTYMRYFLLPRRPAAGARWIVCLNCDRSAYPDAKAVWDDSEQGLAILEMPP